MHGLNALPEHLQKIAAALCDAFGPGADISLDAIGAAVGTSKISTDEIELLFRALEHEGRTIAKGPAGAGIGKKRLAEVLDAARALREKLGRTPTRAEIGEATGLSEDEIQHALALAQVMQR